MTTLILHFVLFVAFCVVIYTAIKQAADKDQTYIYGLRTKKTLSSIDNWRKIHIQILDVFPKVFTILFIINFLILILAMYYFGSFQITENNIRVVLVVFIALPSIVLFFIALYFNSKLEMCRE